MAKPKHTKTPWKIYRCTHADEAPECACGLNGVSFDASYDECHHTLGLEDAKFIVRAVNAHEKLVEALQEIADYSPSETELAPELARTALRLVRGEG